MCLSPARHHLLLQLPALVLLLLAGCDSGPKTYEVTGAAKFEGQPIEEGTITFEDPATGYASQATLGAGGAYTVEIPAGSYSVYVEPLMERIKLPNSPPDDVYKKVDNIPAKYWRIDTSDLKAEVSADKTQHDFDLQR